MPRVTLSDPVRIAETGEITTIAALADAGRVKFTRSANFAASSRGKSRVAYFAELPDGGCWEIGKMAYESRMGLPVTLGKDS